MLFTAVTRVSLLTRTCAGPTPTDPDRHTLTHQAVLAPTSLGLDPIPGPLTQRQGSAAGGHLTTHTPLHPGSKGGQGAGLGPEGDPPAAPVVMTPGPAAVPAQRTAWARRTALVARRKVWEAGPGVHTWTALRPGGTAPRHTPTHTLRGTSAPAGEVWEVWGLGMGARRLTPERHPLAAAAAGAGLGVGMGSGRPMMRLLLVPQAARDRDRVGRPSETTETATWALRLAGGPAMVKGMGVTTGTGGESGGQAGMKAGPGAGAGGLGALGVGASGRTGTEGLTGAGIGATGAGREGSAGRGAIRAEVHAR